MASSGARELRNLCETCADMFERGKMLDSSNWRQKLTHRTSATFYKATETCYVCQVLWKLLPPRERDHYAKGGEWARGSFPFDVRTIHGLPGSSQCCWTFTYRSFDGEDKDENEVPLAGVDFVAVQVEGLSGTALLDSYR